MKQPRTWLVGIMLLALLVVGASKAASGQGLLPSMAEPAEEKAFMGSKFTYQGYLTDGAAPANGYYDFRFTITTSAKEEGTGQTDGKILPGPITFDNVMVKDGLFTVELDFGTSIFSGTMYYLEIEVRAGSSTGSYTKLTPRQPIRAVPYAFSLVPGAEISGLDDAGDMLSVSNNGLGGAIWAYTYSQSEPAIFGWGIRGNGVEGESGASSGTGVYGFNQASTGNAYGVQGTSNSTEGVGVYGYAKKYAVVGRTSVTSGQVYGVQGLTSSTGGTGVMGWADAASGTTSGVYGRSDSSSGYGGNFYNSAGGIGAYAYSYNGSKDLVLGGSMGNVYSSSTNDAALGLFSYDNVEIHLDENNNDTNSFFSIFNGVNDAKWWVYEDGSHTAKGTNSAVVWTELFGWRMLYAMDSPEVWLEDFGTASLVDGTTSVAVEPIFAQTVNLKVDYHVYLTPLGDCALYVSEKTTEGFSVRAMGGATCSIDFDYRIVAKRLGYEDVRLEAVPGDKGGPVPMINNDKNNQAIEEQLPAPIETPEFDGGQP